MESTRDQQSEELTLEQTIAELKISKDKYKYLSNQFEAILDHIPGLVFYKDTKNNFIRVNKYLADMHKMDKNELEGKNLSEIYPKEDALKYYVDDLEVINSGEAKLSVEETWETENGMRWVNTSKIPFINNAGDIIGVIGLSFDITERKKAENELKILQQAVEQSPAAIVITELDGTISFVNKAFETITGYTYAEAIGETPQILKFNQEAKVNYEELWQTILAGDEWRGVFQNKKKNGELYWESAIISPILGDEGKIIKFLGIKDDITEKHKMEVELEKLTRIDFLTKVNNRRYFFELAENEILRNKRYQNNSAFLMLDIDNFKKINDKFGHSFGDFALEKISEVCLDTIRVTDFMGRLGGEEFGIFLINTDFLEAERVAERLRCNINKLDLVSDEGIKVTLSVSIGLTKPVDFDEELKNIMKRADKALYKAKHLGRNRVAII
ncbi:MAG: diguanylate cyclase [Clostridia bacterium]